MTLRSSNDCARTVYCICGWHRILDFDLSTYPKGKNQSFSPFRNVGLYFLFSAQTWFQGLFKMEIIGRAFSVLESYGKKLDDFQQTTSKMKVELRDQQMQIDGQQKVLGEQQVNILKAQSDIFGQQLNISNQYSRISSMHSELAFAQTNIQAQQKKIEDMEWIVTNLYSKLTYESMNVSDTNRVTSVRKKDGGILILAKLDHAAISGSIQATIRPGGGFDIPVTATQKIESYKNICIWTLYNYNPDTTSLTFQYVEDSRETNLIRSVRIADSLCHFDDGYVVRLNAP